MDIHPSTLISMKVNLDRTFSKGVHVGDEAAISFGAIILTHDYIRGMYQHTWIGKFARLEHTAS